MHHYFAFGCHITSNYPIGELHETLPASPDITIHAQPARDPVDINHLEANPERVTFSVKHTAFYHITQGNVIDIEYDADAHPDNIDLFLLGTAMGVCLQQQGRILLHACAIATTPGEQATSARLICAHSGTGKSTLAYWHYLRGFRVLTDDVACISQQDNHFIVHPGYPRVRVTKDSAKQLCINTQGKRTVTTCDLKYILPTTDRWKNTPLRISSIDVLEKDPQQTRLSASEQLIALQEHSYRHHLLHPQQRLQHHFMMTRQLLDTVKVATISRKVINNTSIDHPTQEMV